MYDVSVYVNDQPIINQSITFIEIEGKKNAQACITLKNLLQFHINSPDINNEKSRSACQGMKHSAIALI